MNNPARNPVRLVVALIACCALLAASCGDDDTAGGEGDTVGDPTAEPSEAEPTTEEPTTEEPAGEEPDGEEPAGEEPAGGQGDDATDVELTASFRGVTADTITIGISMLDFDFLVENNFAPSGWGDQQLVWETYIDAVNANGGINGRMLEAVYEYYSPIGTTEAEAACLKLTEDTESFAVLGGFLGPAEVGNTCITGVQDTILVGGRLSAERLEQAEAPWIQSATIRERRLGMFLDLLDQDGRLQGAEIAVIGSIELEDVFEQAEGELQARGVEPVVVAVNDVPQGEAVAQDNRWQVLAENVRAAGADTVLVIGSTQSALRGIDTAGLDVEIWALEPDGLLNLGEATSPEQAHGTVTITGLTDQEIWEEPGTVECRNTFAAAHPEIDLVSPDELLEGEEAWFNPIMSYCRWLELFVLVATEAGPDLTQDSFAAAAERLTEFSLPGVPFASLGVGKFDANDSFRLAVFDAGASDSGDLVPLTEVLDGTP